MLTPPNPLKSRQELDAELDDAARAWLDEALAEAAHDAADAAADRTRPPRPHHRRSPAYWPPSLPDDATEGTIATLPLAWRTPYDGDPGAAPHRALRPHHARPAPRRLSAEMPGKSIRVGLEPEPGCTVETDRRRDRPPHRGRPRLASASASTPATSPPPSRTPRATGARLPWPPPRVRDRQVDQLARTPGGTPRTRTCPRSAPHSPRSPNPASCTRPAPARRPGRAAPTTSPRPSPAGRSRTPPPGAPTSTYRCTHPRRPR
ncbi:hypothetical protein SBADM41S_03131 [Streptomyces badius]